MTAPVVGLRGGGTVVALCGLGGKLVEELLDGVRLGGSWCGGWW